MEFKLGILELKLGINAKMSSLYVILGKLCIKSRVDFLTASEFPKDIILFIYRQLITKPIVDKNADIVITTKKIIHANTYTIKQMDKMNKNNVFQLIQGP